MRIVSYNLRCDVKADGVNSFRNRRGFVMDKLESEMADVIGFQEVTPPMNEYLRSHLKGYTLVGCGRGKDYHDEHNPIAFRNDKYELIGLDVSWLSETPFAPGSRFPVQSICPRIITHAILRPIGDGEPFHVYNTHLDHESSEARVLGAKRLIGKMTDDQKTHPFPLALTGDFNAEPEAKEIMLLKEDAFGLIDQTIDMGCTWHNWGRKTDGQIDYIFTRGFVKKGEAELWKDELNGVYLSDHYPLAIEIYREDEGAI
ncbi:MAG: endonuclease/exonuclease/phosphatase family protein [Clostridia bacterium]|nr:endonuclease/exonuclease/phosphatase family protein [Clostridia bacterium]